MLSAANATSPPWAARPCLPLPFVPREANVSPEADLLSAIAIFYHIALCYTSLTSLRLRATLPLRTQVPPLLCGTAPAVFHGVLIFQNSYPLALDPRPCEIETITRKLFATKILATANAKLAGKRCSSSLNSLWLNILPLNPLECYMERQRFCNFFAFIYGMG